MRQYTEDFNVFTKIHCCAIDDDRCVLTVDGVEHVSEASVVSVQDNAGRQQVTCALAAGVHPDDVEFDGSLTLREGGVLNIPSIPW
jgi:hypothetical protein